ncbi:class C beta-lactamase [Cupriavidus gilardii]|uniref:class C beta-lactamase n=1 Tax=Cupriavidus gilardii TaxID=82541 RepID=UPI0015811FAA|nr:class C beta-lactamase [Cupriavidus gilardii]MCT9070547.1 beta-lactamase [Cupriavidus gilardii]QKS61082.1 beta-lactamase [Cupriavidus gilardii]
MKPSKLSFSGPLSPRAWLRFCVCVCVCSASVSANTYAADDGEAARIAAIVDAAVKPVIAQHRLRGMAVGVTVGGKRYFYNYGQTAMRGGRPVTKETLFEIGSVSKTFAATLAAYAEASGKLSLQDPVSRHMPALRGGTFDKVTLLQLGTHTSGLPLAVPERIRSERDMVEYLSAWRPPYPVGTHRVYSNNGIGLLGAIAANCLGGAYSELVRTIVFEPLGMKHSYFKVPIERQADHAQGYTAGDTPIRMKEGYLWEPAYGIRSSSGDLVAFVEANMPGARIDDTLRQAIARTQVPRFRAGPITQDLVWEQYRYPAPLQQLLAGNAAILRAEAATAVDAAPSGQPAYLHKTGSTNGYSAYVAFVPDKRIGIVLLANKAYPVDQRVTIGYEVLSRLAGPVKP